jgi:Terpene synthase family 2, C-terminal metal binding
MRSTPPDMPDRQPAVVPELWCPIASAIHSRASQLEDDGISWMRRFGYITSTEQEKKAREVQFGTLAAMVYPQADYEVAEFGRDLLIWLFLQDDAYAECDRWRDQLQFARHVIRTLRILDDPVHLPDDVPVDEQRHVLALQDLWLRLPRLADQEQVQRLADGIIEFFAAASTEVIFRCAAKMPTLVEYVRFRESSIVLRRGCFVVTELASGPLPRSVWMQSETSQLIRAAVRVAAWTNDILSGLRELHWPGAINLVTVMADEKNCALDTALDLAVQMHAEETRKFMALASRVRGRHADSHTAHYVAGLQSWIRGNQDWSYLTGRYHIHGPVAAPSGPGEFGE